MRTFRPATIVLPSGVQASVRPSPPILISAAQAFVRTSHNLTVPSELQLASSDSFVGFHATRSIEPECPRSSVEFLTEALSGFQTRSVRSPVPVAIRWPVGLHARVRILEAS